jgi:hypothetical protein
MIDQQQTLPIRVAPPSSPAITASIVLTSLLFAWHAIALLLYNLPPNPLTNQTRGVVNAYIGSLFSQGWSFFAPDPVADNIDVYFRYRTGGTRGRPTTSGWIDMTRAIRDAVNNNRLAPLAIVDASVTGSTVALGNDHFLLNLKPSKRHPVSLFSNRESYDLTTLERTAMVLAQSQLPADRPYQIQLMLREWRFPRFTHRADADNASTAPSILINYPWKPGTPVAGFQ